MNGKWEGVSETYAYLAEIAVKTGASEEKVREYYQWPVTSVTIYMELLEAIKEGLPDVVLEEVAGANGLYEAMKARHLALYQMYRPTKTPEQKEELENMVLQCREALGELLKKEKEEPDFSKLEKSLMEMKQLLKKLEKTVEEGKGLLLETQVAGEDERKDRKKGTEIISWLQNTAETVRYKRFLKLLTAEFYPEQLNILQEAYQEGLSLADLKRIADPKMEPERMRSMAAILASRMEPRKGGKRSDERK